MVRFIIIKDKVSIFSLPTNKMLPHSQIICHIRFFSGEILLCGGENHGRPWPCEREGPTKWEGFSFEKYRYSNGIT